MVAVLVALIGAVVVLALAAAYVTVLVSLAAVALALGVVGLVYGLCFSGFYYLMGEQNLGWVVFAVLLTGSGLILGVGEKFKRWVDE